MPGGWLFDKYVGIMNKQCWAQMGFGYISFF